MISQGEMRWAPLPAPAGAEPGFRRPVVIVQGGDFNASRIATGVVVPLTSNERLAAAPGNVLLPATATGLPRDSVANVSQVVAIDRAVLTARLSQLADSYLRRVVAGIDLVIGHG